MPKISVLLSTVRDNYPMIHRPQTFIFKPTIESLESQTFKDFELVLVDYRKDIRGTLIPKTSFPLKHVWPKPSIWDKIRYPAIFNGYNTSVINADGELCVIISDCCALSENFLERCWYWYTKHNCFAASLFDYDMSNRRDNRYRDKLIEKKKNCPINGRYACWGYNTCSLDAFFKVNGYDENFDGSTGFGDDDIGQRLGLARYKFMLDSEMKVSVFEHNKPIKTKDYLCGRRAKSNELYFNFKWNKHARQLFANTGIFDQMGFKNYEKIDFASIQEYFNNISEYQLIRNLYIEHPSNFNLKSLWENRSTQSLK